MDGRTHGRVRADYERRIALARANGERVDRLVIWRKSPRPSPVMVWTPEQTRRSLDRAARDRLYGMFHLIAFRGLRRGEAVGLSWSDIDLDKAELHVTWQVVQLGWETDEAPPKADSVRTVPLDADTVAALRAWRERQSAERDAWGPAWVETGWVFTAENGEGLHPANVTALFERLACEADQPSIRLHDLRHGAATLLGDVGGADLKIVQEMLGHSTITLTADTYTSVLPEVAEAATRLVPRKTPVTGPTAPTDPAEPADPFPIPSAPDSQAKSRSKKTKDQVRRGAPDGKRRTSQTTGELRKRPGLTVEARIPLATS